VAVQLDFKASGNKAVSGSAAVVSSDHEGVNDPRGPLTAEENSRSLVWNWHILPSGTDASDVRIWGEQQTSRSRRGTARTGITHRVGRPIVMTVGHDPGCVKTYAEQKTLAGRQLGIDLGIAGEGEEGAAGHDVVDDVGVVTACSADQGVQLPHG
jgi:hypothetical protein